LVADTPPDAASNAWVVIIFLAILWYFFDVSPAAVFTWVYDFCAIFFKGFFGIFLK